MHGTIVGKFLSLFMGIVVFFNGISFGNPKDRVKISYEFANEIMGSAAGTVTVEAKIGGDYDLYWGDEDDDKLTFDVGKYDVTYSEFATVEVKKGIGSTEIQSFTAIPEGAESVLVYKNSTVKAKLDLPESKITDNGEELYRFGALSDLHYNRYYLSLGDDSLATFPNALNFLDLCDVDLVAMTGDLSNNGERDAFQKFNATASKYDFPVYTCTGNHDVHGEGLDLESWHEYVNTGVYGEEKREGVVEVAPNQVDFVYAPQAANGDVFIFLSQYAWSYNSESSRILTDAQLDWLGTQLEKYKDTTVYLFFHTFVRNLEEGGNINMGEGNLINSKGAHYNLIYTQGTADEVRFVNYLHEYKNVVFFNGHSHWRYAMQKYNKNLNIANYGGEYATMVHVSSVSSPRSIKSDKSKDYKDNNMRHSEGLLVTVYESRIVINAIDFMTGEMLAYATYNIDR